MEISLKVTPGPLKLITTGEYVSCKMTLGDLWSPINKHNYCYITVGHKLTPMLLMHAQI